MIDEISSKTYLRNGEEEMVDNIMSKVKKT